jgi:prolyl 4-hydroxylase
MASERDPGECKDYSNNCPTWHAAGECANNKGFMGDTCRKTCGTCESCGPREWDCINRNRERSHYLPIDRDEMRMLGVDLFDAMKVEPSPEL